MKYEIQKDLITILYRQYQFDECEGTECLKYIVYNAIDEYDYKQYYEKSFYNFDLAYKYANELHEKTQTEDICEFGE